MKIQTNRAISAFAIALLTLPFLTMAETSLITEETSTQPAVATEANLENATVVETDPAVEASLSTMVADLVTDLAVEMSSTSPVLALETSSTTATTTVTASTTDSTSSTTPNVQREYKQSFAALLSGDQEVPPTPSTAVGSAIFNVSMDERTIDFAVAASGTGSITDIVLACAPRGFNGTTVVSLLNTAISSSNTSGNQVASGSIVKDDIFAAAFDACRPNIETTSHLVQAMREGSIYINILTSAYPNGEIRGQLYDTNTTVLPPIVVNPTNPGTDNPATTTDPVPDTGGNGGGSDNDDDDDSGSSNGGGGRRGSGSNNDNDDDNGEVLGASTGLYSCMDDAFLIDYIRAGGANDAYNVALLQIFLNDYLDAGLTLTGVYDSATQASVNAFQVQEYETVLRPWVAFGLPTETTPTGYVYKTTKWRIDTLACGATIPIPELP